MIKEYFRESSTAGVQTRIDEYKILYPEEDWTVTFTDIVYNENEKDAWFECHVTREKG